MTTIRAIRAAAPCVPSIFRNASVTSQTIAVGMGMDWGAFDRPMIGSLKRYHHTPTP